MILHVAVYQLKNPSSHTPAAMTEFRIRNTYFRLSSNSRCILCFACLPEDDTRDGQTIYIDESHKQSPSSKRSLLNLKLGRSPNANVRIQILM
jgi:hypothetical protein